MLLGQINLRPHSPARRSRGEQRARAHATATEEKGPTPRRGGRGRHGRGCALELAHAQVEKGPGAMAGRREGEEPASPPSLPSVDLVARSSSEEATGGRGAAPPVLDLASARGRRGSRAAGARCRTGTPRCSSEEATGGRGAAPPVLAGTPRRSSEEATGGRGAAPARMGAGLLAQPKWGLVRGFGCPHKFGVRNRSCSKTMKLEPLTALELAQNT